MNLLKEYRTLKQLSQEEVARQVDISLSHYQRIEKGKNLPTIIIGLKIAKLFEVDPYKLFGVE
jgi:putative transcriptional regulator